MSQFEREDVPLVIFEELFQSRSLHWSCQLVKGKAEAFRASFENVDDFVKEKVEVRQS